MIQDNVFVWNPVEIHTKPPKISSGAEVCQTNQNTPVPSTRKPRKYPLAADSKILARLPSSNFFKSNQFFLNYHKFKATPDNLSFQKKRYK